MKKQITFTIILLSAFICNSIMAQVTQSEQIMSHGPQNGYTMEHPDASEKHVEEAWKDFLKEYDVKPKKNRKSNEIEAFEVSIPMISANPLSIYLSIEEKKEMATSSIFFDDGTAYIDQNNSPDGNSNIEKLLSRFQNSVEKLAVEDILEDEEKMGKNLEKDLEKLAKQNEDLHQDIEDFQNKIAQAELDIEKNLSEQDTKQVEIKEQMGVIEKVKDRLNNIGKDN